MFGFEIFLLFFLFLLLIPVFRGLSRIRQTQEADTKKLSFQIRDVQDSLERQRAVLNRLLEQAGASPRTVPEHAVKTPVILVTEIAPPVTADSAPEGTDSRSNTDVDAALPATAAVLPDEQPETMPPNKGPVRAGVDFAELAAAVSSRRTNPFMSEDRPATKPRVQPEPSRFESAAADVLKRIWNWIIVGEEHIPEGVSKEFAIASQWLLRVGIILLVVGVGFFLKYSIEHQMLSETARCLLATAGGFVMLIVGTKILGGNFHIMGQGLLGGGLATLYFSAFAAANFYHLVSMPQAFVAMILVTILAGFLSVRFQSTLTAVLGIIGGYGTPIMLSSGVVNFPGLYGYMLVLGLGVLGICVWKRWPLLNYLSFVGNYGLLFGSLRQYEPTLHFHQVMPFLVAFFVLFSTMVFMYNLFNRTKSNLLDVLVLFLNAGVFFAVSYDLIDQSYSEKWVAVVTLGLAAFYMGHVWYCLVRHILDRELMLSFTALSSFFLAITVPLLLSREWITVSWAVQALVMLWVAGKLNSEFLRHIAYVLYLIVLARFAFLDLPSQYGSANLSDLPFAEYLGHLLERLVMFGVPIASLAMGYRLLTKPGGTASLAVDRAADIEGLIRGQRAAKTAVFVMFGMLFFYMHLELNRTLGELFPPLRLPALTLLWLGICVLLVSEFAKTSSKPVLGFLIVFVTALFLKLFLFDLHSWAATSQFLYGGPYSVSDAAFRLLDFGAIIAFFTFACRLLVRQTHARRAGHLMGVFSLSMLFLYLTLEVNSILKAYVEGLRSGGVSILWSVFALSLLLSGIAKNIRPLRYAGLALFTVVAWKIFFVDLARLDQLYRIVAFIVMGALVLCGSFLYLRSRQTFVTTPASPNSMADAPTLDQPVQDKQS